MWHVTVILSKNHMTVISSNISIVQVISKFYLEVNEVAVLGSVSDLSPFAAAAAVT